MRIVLKPLGAFLIISGFLILTVLLLRKGGHDVTATSAAAAPPTAPAAVAPVADSVNLLANPSFEDSYKAIQPYDNKAVLQGTTPSPWRDDSSWAHVDAAYAPETSQPHSGTHCLKMDVLSVKPGANGLDAVQLIQEVNLTTGKHYSAGIWIRADRSVPVTLAIRQAAEPFAIYGTVTANVTKEWQHVTVDASMTGQGSSYFMVSATSPATIWVDDASLTTDRL